MCPLYHVQSFHSQLVLRLRRRGHRYHHSPDGRRRLECSSFVLVSSVHMLALSDNYGFQTQILLSHLIGWHPLQAGPDEYDTLPDRALTVSIPSLCRLGEYWATSATDGLSVEIILQHAPSIRLACSIHLPRTKSIVPSIWTQLPRILKSPMQVPGLGALNHDRR